MKNSCLHSSKPIRWLSTVGVLLIGYGASLALSQEAPPPIPNPVSQTSRSTTPQASANNSPDPIEIFRQLLAADAAERQKSLAAKSEPKRKYIEAKLLEYDRLPSGEKESRLQILQLRYYLEPLMRMPAENRPSQLATVPAEYARLVKERLAEWDLLPPPLQKDLLDTEVARLYFTRLENGSPVESEESWKLFPPDRREELEDEIAKLQITPLEQRQKLYTRFDRFFEFSEDEKRKTMASLPQLGRRQALEAIDAVEKYPPQQRKQFITSFRKVANMTPAEREKFLKNAERWQAMSAEERRAWRELVATLPPLPPGMPLPLPGVVPKEAKP